MKKCYLPAWPHTPYVWRNTKIFFLMLLEIWMVKVVCFHASSVKAGHWVLTAAWYSIFIPSHRAVNSLLHQRTNYNSHVSTPASAEEPSHPWLPSALTGWKQPYHSPPCWVWAVTCTRTASQKLTQLMEIANSEMAKDEQELLNKNENLIDFQQLLLCNIDYSFETDWAVLRRAGCRREKRKICDSHERPEPLKDFGDNTE